MPGIRQILELFAIWDARCDAIPLEELIQSLKELCVDRAELAEALAFDHHAYCRVSIAHRPHYEALLLCWKSGQHSPIHDHTGSACAVRVIEGRATETRFKRSPCGRLVPLDSTVYGPGEVTGCRDRGIHQMANLEMPGNDLLTLHVYSPPPSLWRSYRLSQTIFDGNDRMIENPARTISIPIGEVRQPTGGLSIGEDVASESFTSPDSAPVVAIVGGGFSGSMVAVHLARLSASRPLRIVLFEKGERFGRGLAYSTACKHHLLNVPAGSMSALPDEPHHFLDWLQKRDPSAHQGNFAPRQLYGEYLDELLQSAQRGSAARIELVRDEVVDIQFEEGGATVQLKTLAGKQLTANRVVLALGHPVPQDPTGLNLSKLSDRYVANPWNHEALEGLQPQASIALIGTGLTAVDLLVQAQAQGHLGTVYAISRHGLLPRGHQSAVPRPHFTLGASAPTARSLLRQVRSDAARCQEEGGDWRSVIDGLRPVAQTLWRSLEDRERARFVRHLAPRWDVHRHRVAPEIDQVLEQAQQLGRLVVLAGNIVSFEETAGQIALTIRPRGINETQTILVDRIINCTGPARDIRIGSSSLLKSIVDRGIGRPGPLALGLDVADSGALISLDGRERGRIFAIGPLLKEHLWETTAVRELRTQAFQLARRVLGHPAD